MKITNLVLLIINLAFLWQGSLCNRYTGLLMMEDHHFDGWDDSYSPYVNETFMLGAKCGEVANFFREIILPFVDDQYRILINFRNDYFLDRGVDPIEVWTNWLISDMATKYDFKSFIANGVNGAVYKVCRRGGYCRAIKIQRDRRGSFFKKYLKIKQLLKGEFLNRVYYIEHQGRFVFMVMRLGDANLNQLIKKKAMREIQKLNVIHDLLVGMHNYQKFKLIHGDLKPANILVKIDEHKYPDIVANLKRKVKVNRDSDIIPMIADFEQYGILTKKNGEYYSDKVYKKGGKVRLSDKVEKKDRMRRYSPRFKAYEVWKAKRNEFGPGADIYAMGLTVYYVWFSKPPEELSKSCRTISLKECKVKIKGMNERFDNMDLKARTSEECVLEVVRGMIRFNPLRRDTPMKSKNLFLECLNKNGFKTPTEEELEDLKNDDLKEMNEIKKKK